MPDTLRLNRADEAGSLPPRQAYSGPQAGWLETPVLRRADRATPREGPCIIEEYDATCVVPPRVCATLEAYGNLVLDL